MNRSLFPSSVFSFLPLLRSFSSCATKLRPPPSFSPSSSSPSSSPLSPAPPPSHPPLLDSFSRFHNYLRVSLTERCNMRCVYCMPAEGVELSPAASLLTAEEIGELIEVFVELGVEKVRFTGGEPLVRRDVEDIVRRTGKMLIKQHNTSPASSSSSSSSPSPSAAASSSSSPSDAASPPSSSSSSFPPLPSPSSPSSSLPPLPRPRGLRQLCMTTNGLLLPRYLPSLLSSGLSHVNLSLDTFDPLLFDVLTRSHKAFPRVHAALLSLLSLQSAPSSPLRKVKVNCVVQRGVNDAELSSFVQFTRDNAVEVRFIEYMPFGGNKWERRRFVAMGEMMERIRGDFPGQIEALPSPDGEGPTARLFAVKGHRGSFGFISSMSDHFCSSCNRLRLNADGSVKVCLFGNEERSLRDVLREGKREGKRWEEIKEEVKRVIGEEVWKKKEKHAGMDNLVHMENRPMVKIGG